MGRKHGDDAPRAEAEGLMEPVWSPGLWNLLRNKRSGDRVELLDYDRTHRWFQVVARSWDSKTGKIDRVALRRWRDGEKAEAYVAGPLGWFRLSSKEPVLY